MYRELESTGAGVVLAAAIEPDAERAADTAAKFGIPVPDSGGLVTNTIGININFSLTPADSVGISANFTANPVPEPASMMAVALAGLTLALRRRK